jgi:hypothetical protein
MVGRTTRPSAKSWSETDLVSRLCRALDVADRAIRLLAADGYSDPEHPAESIRGEKVVVEAGILLLASAPASLRHPEIGQRVERVAATLIPHARGERVQARICLEPALALDHAAAHVCLSRIGFPDPWVDHLLRASLSAEAAGSRERVPHRQLEQEWLQRVWDPEASYLSRDPSLPRQSALARSIDLVPPNTDDVYAFTHALIYLTDLGERRGRLPRSRSLIAAEAEALLAACLDAPDYDLAGEILLTWPLQGQRWSPAAALGFGILAAVEDRARVLPGPGIALDRLQALRGEKRTNYAVASAYHTAFVMGLLCAVALRPGRRPPDVAAGGYGDTRRSAIVHELLALLEQDERPPAWRRHVESLPSCSLGSAADLVFNICIARAARRRDLDLLRSTLLVGQRYDLLDAPAARQAGQLLSRCALLADLPSRSTACR